MSTAFRQEGTCASIYLGSVVNSSSRGPDAFEVAGGGVEAGGAVYAGCEVVGAVGAGWDAVAGSRVSEGVASTGAATRR